MTSTSFTCGVAPVTSVGPVCSGNGVCQFDPSLNRGVCLCNAGWQGESDFQVTNSLLDCQINTVAIRSMWGVVLGLLLIVLFKFHIPYGRWLWAKHKTLVDRNKASGRVYRLRDNKGLFSVVPYLLVGWPMMLILAITKIADQDLKLGNSVLVTILYIIWRACFFFAPDIIQPALLETLLKTEKNLAHIIRINWQFNLIHLVCIQMVSILVIIPMVVGQDPLLPVVGMTSFAVFANLIAIAFISLAIQARYIGNRVQVALVSSYALTKDERTRKIMNKIRKHQRDIIKGTIAQTLIFGTFGAFPYMWNKHDYLMPISILASAMQIKVGLESLVQEEDKTSSKGATSPDNPKNRKMVVRSDEGSSVADSGNAPKEPYVHGLDLEPFRSNASATFQSTVEGDAEVAPPPSEHQGAVRVQISPAMKLLRSLTPSKKPKASFFEQGLGDETHADAAYMRESKV